MHWRILGTQNASRFIKQDKSETTIDLGNILVYYHISLCMEASWEVDITASDTVLQDLSSFDVVVCYIALLSAQAIYLVPIGVT